MTPFGSESPKSISTSESKDENKNKSASTSSGHSRGGSQSVNPTPDSRETTPTLTRTPTDTRSRSRPRTHPRPRTAMMSTSQTVTSTAAAESGSRYTSSAEAYRYQGLPRANPYSISPTRTSSLFVNATATISAGLSGSAGSSAGASSRAREAASNEEAESQQRQWEAQTGSYSHWSARIGEIPIDDADATEAPPLRSPSSAYGPASASDPLTTAGFAHSRQSPHQLRRGHVAYRPDYGSVLSSSGTAASGAPEPEVFRPPSLASYTLTEPAAQASAGAGPSSWRDTVIGSSSSSSSTAAAGWLPPLPPLPPLQYLPSYRRSAAQWNSPPLAARSATSSVPFALPGASPTHTGSPASTSGTATSSSWAPIPSSALAELEESVRSRSASTLANKVLSSTSGAAATTTMRRPSLARSAAALPSSSTSSSSSMLHSAFELVAGSRSSITSTAAPTSASAASASASRVPGPASSYDASLPFNARSPAAQSSVSGLAASEHSPSFARFAAGNPQAAAIASTEQQQELQLQPASSPYDVQEHSSGSAQLTRSDGSPAHERDQLEPAAAFQAPFQQSSLSPGTRAKARDSSRSGSGAMAAGPSGQGQAPQDYHLFAGAGTNTSAYSRPFAGPSSVSDPGPSSLVGRPATLQHTVPVSNTAAEPYNYPYASPPAGTAPPSSSASAAVPVAAPGNSGGSGQSTRKRNHACWMCHKSFDRPSTLRKHLLVHTGEKAYVCTICGRRFGVASNLNRHTRRCIARPVNSSSFHQTSEAAPGTLASAGTLTAPDQDAMAREQTNPDVRRGEREREGREVPEDDSERPAASSETPGTPGPSTAPQTRGRRRVRSDSPAPLGAASSLPEAGPSSQQTPFHLRPAFSGGGGGGGGGSGGDGQGSGQVAVATASTSTAEAEAERRPKRRRRAPSPSRWVPASLRAFSLSPTRHRTSTPLPPVSPGFDRATGTWEERDSYATPDDENVDPVGESSSSSSVDPSAMADNAARRREERRRNFEYCPYHPCGWTGRLPGPAVVGSDLTNYTKPIGGGGSGSRHYPGGSTGGGLSFMFEFSVAAAG